MVLGIISVYKLKLPRANETEHFFGKRFVYSPGEEYRKLSPQVFLHYGEEKLKKTDRPFFLAILSSKWEFFLSGRYQAEP